MKGFIQTASFIIFVCLLLSASLLASVHEAVAQSLDHPRFQDANLSIIFYSLTDDELIVAQNEHDTYMPASLLKVPLSLLLLDKLGPSYRFKTVCYTDWLPGERAPNLYIKASGDPNISTEQLKHLAATLKSKGFTRFNRLILNTGHIASDEDLFPNRGIYYYATSHAFNVNYNQLHISFDDNGQSNWQPNSDYVHVDDSQLRLYLDFNEARYPHLQLQVSDDHETIYLQGEATQADINSIGLTARVASGNAFFESLLLKYLAKQGIQFEKAPEKQLFSTVFKRPIYTLESEPLSTMIQELNNNSNNMLANALLKQLSLDKSSMSIRSGSAVFNHSIYSTYNSSDRFWKSVDGSGLSKKNRVTASVLMALLKDMYHSKHYNDLKSSLKVLDSHTGFMRLAESVQIYYKTGTLGALGVSNAMGYIDNTRTGETLAFVILGQRRPAGKRVSKGYYSFPLLNAVAQELN